MGSVLEKYYGTETPETTPPASKTTPTGSVLERYYGDQYTPDAPDPKTSTTFGPHYTPTYFENFNNLANYYNGIQSSASDFALPEWMQSDQIIFAFETLRAVNNDTDWTNWTELPANDPMRAFLRSIAEPPLDFQEPQTFNNPDSVSYLFGIRQPLYDPIASPATQKQLNQPDLGYMPSQLPYGSIASTQTDPDVWAKRPGWTKLAAGIIGNPILMQVTNMAPFMLQTAIGATIGFVLGGGPAGAIIGGAAINIARLAGTGVVLGAMQHPETFKKINDTLTPFVGAEKAAEVAQSTAELSQKVLYGLDALAIATEKTIGVAWMGVDAHSKGQLDEFMDELPAAWKAAEMTYEAFTTTEAGKGIQNYPNYIETFIDSVAGGIKDEKWVTGVGQALHYETGELIHLDAYGVSALNQIRNEILAGGDAQTIMGYWQEQFGIGGVIADLGFQILFDPLNVFPDVSRAALGKVADVTKNPYLKTAVAETGVKPRGGPVQVFRQYQKNLYVSYINPDISMQEGWITKERTEYTPFQRFIAGLDEKGDVIKMKPGYKPGLSINPINTFRHLTAMTPQAKFDTYSEHMNVYLRQAVIRAQGMPGEFRAEIERLFNLRPAEGAVIANEMGYGPEWSLWQQSLKNGSGDIKKILDGYDAHAIHRTTLKNVSVALSKTEGEVVAEFFESPEATKDTLVSALVMEPELQAIIDGQTPAEFKKFAKFFRTGTWNETLLNARIDDQTRTIADKARTAIFGVEEPGFMMSALGLGKTIQALLLFSLNPAWMVNNIVNNEATALIHRNFAFMTGSQVKTAMEAYGITTGRVMDQFTNMDLTPDNVARAIRDDAKSTRGAKALGFQDMLKKLIDWSPIVRVSRASEKSGGLRTFYNAFDHYMKEFWVRDKGISRLDPSIETWVNEADGLGPAWMNAFYAAMEDSKTPNEIRAILKDRLGRAMLERNINVFSSDAAKRMGMKLDEFNGFMAKSGGYDIINRRLAEGADVDQAITETITEIEEHIEDLFYNNLLGRTIETPNKLDLEGTRQVIDTFSTLSFGTNVNETENFIALQELFYDMDDIADKDAKNLHYKTTSGVIRRNNARHQKKEKATYIGIAKHLGLLKTAPVLNVSQSVVAIESVLNDRMVNNDTYWTEADRIQQEFYDGPFIDDQVEYRKKYDAMRQEQFDLYMARQADVAVETRRLYSTVEALWLDQISELPIEKYEAAARVMQAYVQLELGIVDTRRGMMQSIRAWEIGRTDLVLPEYVEFFAGRSRDKPNARKVWREFQTAFVLPLQMEKTKNFFDHEYNLHAAVSGFPTDAPPAPPVAPPPTAPPSAPPPEGAPPTTPPTAPPAAPPAAPPVAPPPAPVPPPRNVGHFGPNFGERLNDAFQAVYDIETDGLSPGLIDNIMDEKGFFPKYADPARKRQLQEHVAQWQQFMSEGFDPNDTDMAINKEHIETIISNVAIGALGEIENAYRARTKNLRPRDIVEVATATKRSIKNSADFEKMLMTGEWDSYRVKFHVKGDPVAAAEVREKAMMDTWGFDKYQARTFNKIIESFAEMREKRFGITIEDTMLEIQMLDFTGDIPVELQEWFLDAHALRTPLEQTARQAVIAIADVSPDILVHEMMHVFSHMLPISTIQNILKIFKKDNPKITLTGLNEAMATAGIRYFRDGTAPSSMLKHQFESFRKVMVKLTEPYKATKRAEMGYLGKDWANNDPAAWTELENFYRYIFEERPSDYSVEGWIGKELDRLRDRGEIDTYAQQKELADQMYTDHEESVLEVYRNNWIVSKENIEYYSLGERASSEAIDDGVVGDELDMLWNYENMDTGRLPSYPGNSSGWREFSQYIHPRLRYPDGRIKVFYISDVKNEYGVLNHYTNNRNAAFVDPNRTQDFSPVYVGLWNPFDLEAEYSIKDVSQLVARTNFLQREFAKSPTGLLSGRSIHSIVHNDHRVPQELVDLFMRDGFDGFVYNDGNGDAVAPFTDISIRSIFNKESFSRNKTASIYGKEGNFNDSIDNYQTPIWEANIETAAEAMPDMAVGKVLDWLNKKGINELSIKLSGLDAYLTKQKGKVTGTQIQEYMNAQSMHVSEIEMGTQATLEARTDLKYKEEWRNVNRSLADIGLAVGNGLDAANQFISAGKEVGFVPAEMDATMYIQWLLERQDNMLADVERSAYYGPKNQRRISLTSRITGVTSEAMVSDRYNRGYDRILHIEGFGLDHTAELGMFDLNTKYDLGEIETMSVFPVSNVIKAELKRSKTATITGNRINELLVGEMESNAYRRLVRYAIENDYRGISTAVENSLMDSLAENMATEVVPDNVYANSPQVVFDVYVDGRMEQTFADPQVAEDYRVLREEQGYEDVGIAERDQNVSGSPEEIAYVFRLTDDMFDQAADIGKVDYLFKYDQGYLNFGKRGMKNGSTLADIRSHNVLTSHPGQKSKVFTNGVYSRVILANMIETFNSVYDPFGGGGMVGIIHALGIKNNNNPNGLRHFVNDYDPALYQLHNMLDYASENVASPTVIDPKNVVKPNSLTHRTRMLQDWHIRLRGAFGTIPPDGVATYAKTMMNKMFDNVQNNRRVFDWSERAGGAPKLGPSIRYVGVNGVVTSIVIELPQVNDIDSVVGELPRYRQLNDIGFAQLVSGSPLADRQTFQIVTDDGGTKWKNGNIFDTYQDVIDSVLQRGKDMNRLERRSKVSSVDATEMINEVLALPDFDPNNPNTSYNNKQAAFVALDPPYPWADPSVAEKNYGLLTEAAQEQFRSEGLFTEDRVLDTNIDPLEYNLNFIRNDVSRLVENGVPFVFTNPANKQIVAELTKLGGINFIFYELWNGKKHRAEMLAYPSYMKQEIAERRDPSARNTESGWERWMGGPIHDTAQAMMEPLWAGNNPLIAKTPRLTEDAQGKMFQNPSDMFDGGYNWDNTQSDAAPPAGPDLTPHQNGKYQHRILPRPIPFGIAETTGKMWATRAIFQDGKLVALQPGDLSKQDLKFKFNDGTDGKILGYDYEGNYVVDMGDGQPLQKFNPNPDNPDAVGRAVGNTYDATAGGFPYGEIMSDGFQYATLPGLQSLRSSYHQNRGALDFTGDLADMPPDMKQKVATYLGGEADNLSNTVAAGERYGMMHRDQVLLNYRERANLDTYISAGLPYAFWWTHQMVEWSLRIMDRPALMSHFMKIAKLGDKNREENRDLPSRLDGKWNIPAAWAPAYTGQQMWVDPIGKLFPLFEISRPFERMLQTESRQIKDTERLINKMYYQDKSISLEEARFAMSTHAGPLWDQASSIAKSEMDTGMLDWIGMFSSPAMWLTYPWKLINGKANELNPLPISRTLQGLATATGIDALRLLDIEAHIRNNAKISEFGEFGDWYIDRQMSALAAENPQSVSEIEQDFINRSGPWWDQAYERVRFEMMIRQPFMGSIYATNQALQGKASISDAMGSMLFGWLPSGMVAPAELHQRGLYDEYQQAWTDYNAGDPDAIDTFFDAYPEYKIQAALYKRPDERLHQYLVNDIWEAWYRLPKATQDEAKKALGPTFDANFISSATRDTDGISNQTLAIWSNELGGRVPSSYKPEDGNLVDLPPESVNIKYQRYLKEKDDKFGYIGDVSAAYYQADDVMKEWIRDNTNIIEYWAWKDKQMADNPDLMPYMISEQSNLAGVDPGTAQLYYNYKVKFAEDFPNYWDDVNKWIDNGKKNPSADLKAAWNFENETMSQYPQLIPLTETTAEGVEKQMKYSNVTPEQVIIQAEFTPPLRESLFQHFNFGDNLGAGAMQELLRVYALTDPGKPFSEWVEGLETFYQ